jgi:hypothetical protein
VGFDYCFHDPRVVLLPPEHLTPGGVDGDLAGCLIERAGWTTEAVALFNAAFARYWVRTAALAARAREWAPPRRRHVAVVGDPLSVHPLAQLLNVNAWTLYASDLDPAVSDPEFAAYLLVHGDRCTLLRDVARAALHNAAYWFERTDAECTAFAAAAARVPRPDAPAFQALAAAAVWLRRLHHEALRPADAASCRGIPDTGLLVPASIAAEPPALVERWAHVARAVLARYQARWRGADLTAVRALCDWLAGDAPPLLVTAARGHLLWDPAHPSRVGALRGALRGASGAGVRDVHADLRTIADHSRRFLAAVCDPDALPAPPADFAQEGYAYMHRTRRLVAYNIEEPGLERLAGPALPFARAMLGARVVHEWAHLAVEAGWVPLAVAPARYDELTGALTAELDAALDAAAAPIRTVTAGDVAALAAGGSAATALTGILCSRLPDFQANLLAQRFLDDAERETYVRQNIRPLRAAYPPARRWRMLVRYLYEFQYLRFSAIADRRAYFLAITGFDTDFFASGALTEERFDHLVDVVGRLCDCYAVDEQRFRPPEPSDTIATEPRRL